MFILRIDSSKNYSGQCSFWYEYGRRWYIKYVIWVVLLLRLVSNFLEGRNIWIIIFPLVILLIFNILEIFNLPTWHFEMWQLCYISVRWGLALMLNSQMLVIALISERLHLSLISNADENFDSPLSNHIKRVQMRTKEKTYLISI